MKSSNLVVRFQNHNFVVVKKLFIGVSKPMFTTDDYNLAQDWIVDWENGTDRIASEIAKEIQEGNL